MAEAGRVITGSAGGIRLLAPGEGDMAHLGQGEAVAVRVARVGGDDAWGAPGAGSRRGQRRLRHRGAQPRRVPGGVRGGRCRGRQGHRGEPSAGEARGGSVVRRDALRWLAAGSAAAGEDGGPFGVVIVDPPYKETALLAAALAHLGDPALGWLRDDAIVIAKHFWKDAPPAVAGTLRAVRDRRFGETALRHYRPGQPEQQEPIPA